MTNLAEMKKKIDEKESRLIDDIAEKIASQVDDNLSDSMDSFSETIESADEKIKGISEELDSLSDNIHTLGSYNFAEQFNRLKETQQALDSSANNSREAFDRSREANEQLMTNIASTLTEWTDVKNALVEAVNQVRSENNIISGNLSILDESIKSLTEIDKSVTNTIQIVELKESTIIDEVSQQVSKSAKTLISEKIDSSVAKLSAAVKSANTRIEIMTKETDSLAEKIRNLENYNFTEQFDRLKDIHEKLEKTLTEIQKSMAEFNQTLISWNELSKKFEATISELHKANETAAAVSAELNQRMQTLSDLSKKLESAIDRFDTKSLMLENEELKTMLKELQAKDEILIAETEKLKQQQMKTPTITVVTAIITGILLILNVVSFFIN